MMKCVVLSVCLMVFCGCAGPTSPFGSPSFETESLNNSKNATKVNSIKIRFFPHAQVLHGRSDFSAVIEDPMGIGSDSKVRLFYNNLDVTERFLAQADKTYLNSDHTKVEYSVSNLRIMSLKENRIYFGYMRNLSTQPVFAKYSPPTCSVFDTNRLASTHEFDISNQIKKIIDDASREEKVNPNYLAGLIAQESSFDPKAVSWAKALGLTQISPLGELEILKSHAQWPQYPGANAMTPVALRYLVNRGRINSKNEWRLNPTLSIKGGLDYIRYLQSYWEKPENLGRLKGFKGSRDALLSALILASYNSGPARVNYAIQKYGTAWLQASPELSEARLYVTRVTSYCDYFSHSEDEAL